MQSTTANTPTPSFNKSLSAMFDMIFTPPSALSTMEKGLVHSWVPWLLATACELVWLYTHYSTGRLPIQIAGTILLELVIVGIQVTTVTLIVAAVLWAGGARFNLAQLFTLAFSVTFITRLLLLIAALLGQLFFDIDTDIAQQNLSNFAWMISQEEQRPLHQLLVKLDIARLYGLALFTVGATMLIRNIPRAKTASLILATWLAFVTTLTAIKWYVS